MPGCRDGARLGPFSYFAWAGGIKVGGVGLKNEGRYRFNSFPEWNREVLSLAGQEMDFFDQHNAYAPVGIGAKVSFRDGYRALLAAPVRIQRNLREVATEARALGAGRGGRLPLAVTEWGALFHITTESPWTDHAKTLGAALFTASLLKAFVEVPELEIALQFKLTGLLYMGLLATPQGTKFSKSLDYPFRPTSPYLAMQLFTQHTGEVLVASETDSPSFPGPEIGWSSAVPAAPYLETLATINEDGSRLHLLFVNKSFAAPASVRLLIKNFTPSPSGSVWILDGSDLGAHTGTAPVEVPGYAWAGPVRPEGAGPPAADVAIVQSERRDLDAEMQLELRAHSVTVIEMLRVP